MLKKIAKLGLVGLLSTSLFLQGCGTTMQYRTETKTVRASPVKKEISREKFSSRVQYSIDDIIQDKENISIHVTESKYDSFNVKTQVSRDVYEESYRITDSYNDSFSTPLNIVGLPFRILGASATPPIHTGSDSQKISQRKIRTETDIENDKIEKTIYKDNPAPNMFVKVSSEYFGFGDKKINLMLAETDTNGIAKVRITSGPYLWGINESQLKNNVNEIMKKGLKKDALGRIDPESLHFIIKNKKYPVIVNTLSELSLLTTNEDNLKLADANRTFEVSGKEVDISPLYSYIKKMITTELEGMYMPRTFKIKAVLEDAYPTDAVIEFQTLKTLSLEEVLKETENIKEQYLVEGEEIFRHIEIDPSYLIYDLDGKKLNIPPEGIEFILNIPSKYKLKVIKEGYAPAEEIRNFTKDTRKNLEVKMYRLGTPVTIGQGKSTINER